jgi:hypothetical protein
VQLSNRIKILKRLPNLRGLLHMHDRISGGPDRKHAAAHALNPMRRLELLRTFWTTGAIEAEKERGAMTADSIANG